MVRGDKSEVRDIVSFTPHALYTRQPNERLRFEIETSSRNCPRLENLALGHSERSNDIHRETTREDPRRRCWRNARQGAGHGTAAGAQDSLRPLPTRMVRDVKRTVKDWEYDVISIGFPGPVIHGRPVHEPHNLGDGCVGFDFGKAFGRPVKVINDAAMRRSEATKAAGCFSWVSAPGSGRR